MRRSTNVILLKIDSRNMSNIKTKSGSIHESSAQNLTAIQIFIGEMKLTQKVASHVITKEVFLAQS